ncbi:YnjH family protein [Parasalinivibrio latis]|uniref:DUF1496 domain-containing protein n=1 Tax=Parasalinivibrio latis TaxID=2952610 RepID=UPI0030DF43B2
MKFRSFLFIFFAVSTNAVSQTTSTNSMTIKPEIQVDASQITGRVCYFDGKAYSEGAVIKVENILLQCVPEKSFELNGRLMWKNLTAS